MVKHEDVIVSGNWAETRERARQKFKQEAPEEYARFKAYRSIAQEKQEKCDQTHMEWQKACEELKEADDAYGRAVKDMTDKVDGDGQRLYDLMIWGR